MPAGSMDSPCSGEDWQLVEAARTGFPTYSSQNEEGKFIDIQGLAGRSKVRSGEIPPQTGRLAVVTGATGGLGYELARLLAQSCADVILAGRDEAKGREAARRIRALAPNALVRFEKLDLARLSSIATFAGKLRAQGLPVDILVNNAGVMALPDRHLTVDGFEMQLGTNYLGHFALTALLLPLLKASRKRRVVQMSSLAHRIGQIRFDDLHGKWNYRPWAAYSQSKLAALLFARELQRQSDLHGWRLVSTAVHPGLARTNLVTNGPGPRSLTAWLSRPLGRALGQSAENGAQPAVFAATSDDVRPGGFYGPAGMLELTGPPMPARVARHALQEDVARRLWQVSEQLTGVRWPVE